mmetsp:Transcript_12012/g.19930  ORF Transcript_12012/g.19930 Transcript_12012/m.19930 type:complete len:105 (+) Transcript_12012:80-394(+)|eukprot:CAMPEP_0119016246 /NCGR_PEP_ID=MMETSP1176-20130426/11893_1 /TAXON_ID=265551 /ORGANISM="Synedropsis recta cf, Strain CCMP1620" /LENGTH=104 /DNA_ID=CAMNT_0006969587 /DNA_START=80 /DNA_END=394 /DNA_ORIENTATION=+
MSSSKAKQVILSPAAKSSIQKLQNEVFGTLPQLNIKTGYQQMKRMHRGTYIARYYPEPIEKSARLGTPGYLSAQEERRQEKLEILRRRGKGPPKKGSGKRQQKK